MFAPTERICPSCGSGAVTLGRSCPACGAPYVARRAKPLRSRRARVLAAGSVLGLLGVSAAIVALLAPGIDSAKRAHAAAARREAVTARRALLARDSADQRLQLAGGAARDPGASAPRAVRLAARAALVGELRRAITSDARRRVRAGTLTGPILFTTCSPYPAGSAPAESVLGVRTGAYSCLAVNSPIKSAAGTVGELGDPFWARIDFASSRFAWCKTNPRPGEQAVGSVVATVPLARACDLSRPSPVPLP